MRGEISELLEDWADSLSIKAEVRGPALLRLRAGVRALGPSKLLSLDQSIRSSVGQYLTPPLRLRLPELSDLNAASPLDPAQLALFSLSRNGYIREWALKWLARRSSPGALPILLHRCGDWVPVIRRAAEAACLPYIKGENLPHLVVNLPIIVRHQLLIGMRPINVALQELLFSTEGKAALGVHLDAYDSRTRRRILHLIDPEGSPADGALLAWAMASQDCVLRIWALGRVEDLEDEALGRSLLRAAFGDPIPRLRIQALEQLERLYPDYALALAQGGLADSAGRVRELALEIVRGGEPSFDALGYYQKLLDSESPRVRSAAIAAVGSLGGDEHLDELAPYLLDDVPRVRRAAMWAIERLGGVEIFADAFKENIFKSSVSVSRFALASLGRHPGVLDPEVLLGGFFCCEDAGIRKNIIRHFESLPRWTAPTFLLRCIAGSQADIRELAKGQLWRWSIRGRSIYVTPSRAQAAALRLALEGARSAVGEALYGQLQRDLKTWES